MLFGKKKNNEEKCSNCNSNLKEEFSFCPYCGLSLIDKEKELRDFGMLGKNEFSDRNSRETLLAQEGFGFSDKLFSSMFNTIMKSMEKQLRNVDKQMANDISNAEVKPIPGGFSIKISNVKPIKQQPKEISKETTARKGPTQDQLKKISSLPRETAKSEVRRLGNKIIYELGMKGIKSPEDIFVSKLEKGYEIKALGDKNVYVNTIPLDLPVKTFKIEKDKITVEFKTEY